MLHVLSSFSSLRSMPVCTWNQRGTDSVSNTVVCHLLQGGTCYHSLGTASKYCVENPTPKMATRCCMGRVALATWKTPRFRVHPSCFMIHVSCFYLSFFCFRIGISQTLRVEGWRVHAEGPVHAPRTHAVPGLECRVQGFADLEGLVVVVVHPALWRDEPVLHRLQVAVRVSGFGRGAWGWGLGLGAWGFGVRAT